MLTEADCKRDYDGKFKKLSDGQGLQLWVQPNGKRFWRSAFRIGGKQKVLALGQFPIVSRSDAREANRHVKRLLASGLDPVKEKRDRRTALAGAVTFGKMADEFIVLKKKNNRAEATLKKTEWLLDIAKRKLGPMALNDIRPSDIWALLEKIQTRNRFETARRMRITIGGVFRLAIATDRAVIDPTFALRGALACPKAVSHAAITDPREFGALLRAIDGFDGQPTTVTALKLMALLFQRPGELRRAELTEFDFENAIWTIPAGRMKMRREHKVPLSKQAMQIIKDLMGVIADGKYLFPSVRTPTKPISENTLNAALRRLGYAQDEHTSHGFRATASTLLNESNKWNPDAIERQQAREDKNAMRGVYARGPHWDERVAMMQWWADHLDKLKLGGKADTLGSWGKPALRVIQAVEA